MNFFFFTPIQCIKHAGFFFERDVYTHLHPPTCMISERIKSRKRALHVKQKISCKSPYFLQKAFAVPHKGKIPTVDSFFLLGERKLSLWLSILVNYFGALVLQLSNLNIRV